MRRRDWGKGFAGPGMPVTDLSYPGGNHGTDGMKPKYKKINSPVLTFREAFTMCVAEGC